MKSYLITDPAFYEQSIDSFSLYLNTIYLKHGGIDFTCFRDKRNKNNIDVFANKFIKISRKYNIENILINTHIDLAYKYGANGVHLNSTQFDMIGYAKKLNLFVIISTHTLEEALKASEMKADAITFSPVYSSPGKGKPKGLKALREVVDKIDIKCFALGGIITNDQITKCKNAGCFGYASIRKFTS